MNIVQWFKPFMQKSEQFVVKNASHILMGIGTVTGVSAVISAVKVTPAAVNAQKQAKREKNENDDGIYITDLTIKEKVKACWKFYIPAVGMEVLSVACFWTAHGIDVRRQAVLSGLYAAAEQTLQEYQRKVQQLIGEKAEKEVRNAVAQDQVTNLPPPQNNWYIDSEQEDTFIFKGQYFRSCLRKVKEAQNEANWEMIQHMYISEADLIWLLDPDHKYLKPGTDSGQVGWSVDELLVLDIHWVTGQDNRPIGVIEVQNKDGFRYDPSPGFSRMM